MTQPRVRQELYDTYWYFAAERQRIFYKRMRGEGAPYTKDPILAAYKFCNSYRVLDRVSQFLVRTVIYGAPNVQPVDMLLRIFLFRLLNKIETWDALERHVGPVTLQTFSPDRYAKALTTIRETGPIYGNAFILCANKAYGYQEKHRNQLALLDEVFRTSDVGERLLTSRSLQQLYERLLALPLIGPFMAYQIAIDFLYSPHFDFDENDFTVAGPGATRGIAKCFTDIKGMTPAEVIMYMVDRQDEEFARLGLEFQRIGNRKLHAIDCQGLFCETDKYARAAFPDLVSNRVRIKTTFTENPRPIAYYFPPKWSIPPLNS